MHHLLARLVLYSDLAHGTILASIANVYRAYEEATTAGSSLSPGVVTDLRGQANAAAKRILDLATTYGFDRDLWCDYLAYSILTCENSFSLTAEQRGSQPGGTVNEIATDDLACFLELVHWDFTPLEHAIGTHALSRLQHWQAIPKERANYFGNVSQKVRALSTELASYHSAEQAFSLVSDAYLKNGVGLFGLNEAFRIRRTDPLQARDAYTQASYTVGSLEFVPVNNAHPVHLSELVGYELQKERLVANTEAFLAGRPANNVLLYGDAGTGKSTSVKALVSEYADRGLRMIEIYKHQFQDLSRVIETIKHRNYRFIVFIDDLSFEENEVEYKFLKAVIEGGVESRPENVLIYATSNRRHLIRETWNDRNDLEHNGDVHRSDTVEEKLSLSERFGVAINFSTPTPKFYHQIVLELIEREIPERMPKNDEEQAALLKQADRWEIRHGGVSGRTARQFVDYLAGGE